MKWINWSFYSKLFEFCFATESQSLWYLFISLVLIFTRIKQIQKQYKIMLDYGGVFLVWDQW